MSGEQEKEMAAFAKYQRASQGTETTPEGLTTLLYQVTHSASQKLIDPQFARQIGKQIEAEYELLRSQGTFQQCDFSAMEEAMERFHSAVLAEQGCRLTQALTLLRDAGANQLAG